MPKNINAPDITNQIGDIGLEYEFSNCMRDTDNFTELVNRYLPGWQIVHDASAETPRLSVGNYPLQFSNDEEIKNYISLTRDTKIKVFGGELTSPILTPTDIYPNINKLVEILIKTNETVHERGSFHVHVNVGGSAITLPALKKVLTLITAFEAILYRLGGLGRVNRGEINQFIYQRPYLGRGPIVYKRDMKYHPILVVDDLLSSASKREFFDRCGDLIRLNSHGEKYVTSRYMGTNFYSILRYGSVEFRYANTSLNPAYLNAWVELCRAIIFAAFDSRDHALFHEQFPLYKNLEIDDETFTEIMMSLHLFESSCISLFDAWRSSPTPKFENNWIISHLKNPTFYDPCMDTKYYLPKAIEHDDKVTTPDFVDVHILDNEFRDRVKKASNINNDLKFEFKINPVEMRPPEDNDEVFDDDIGDMEEENIDLDNDEDILIADEITHDELMIDNIDYLPVDSILLHKDFLDVPHDAILMKNIQGTMGDYNHKNGKHIYMYALRSNDRLLFYFEDRDNACLNFKMLLYNPTADISPFYSYNHSAIIY